MADISNLDWEDNLPTLMHAASLGTIIVETELRSIEIDLPEWDLDLIDSLEIDLTYLEPDLC